MSWKQHIFKPKWQNKNADVRLESVSSEQHPELIGSLLEIAAKDTDKRVRCAAIKRLHQLENILNLHTGESDKEVRTLLEERIRQLASSSNDSRPPLKFRMQVAETTQDRDLIEHLASHAPESELRRAALARVERQGVLGDCAIQDGDARNRSYAASRIAQHTTLKRVIDALRKKDKALYTDLQARLHQELLARGDAEAVHNEALKICTGLEKQASTTKEKSESEIQHLHDAWQQLSANVDSGMSARYERVCERLAAPAVAATPTAIVEKTEEAPLIKSESTIEPKPAAKENEPVEANAAMARLANEVCLYETENPDNPRAASIQRFSSQLEKIWSQCKPPHPEDQVGHEKAVAALQRLQQKLEQQNQKYEKELAEGNELLVTLESELEQGELHKALETRARLQVLSKGHGKNRDWKKLNGKLSGVQARLRELRDWHHWSNNKIRKRLIAEMEVLPAADLHPDALLDRIKSLQAEWKTLEKSEQIPGDKHFAAAPWMWRKFSAAGHAAFDTAKPYLEKRSEIQSKHAQSLATFCAELEQLAQADPTDWTALGKGLNRGRKKLHDLNNVPARQRQKFARKLKSALDQANGVMQAHYEAVEVEKMKLIRAASQLIHLPERGDAIAQAKALQSSWRSAGALWRSKEQALWNQFRGHLDPLFEELKEQQASVRAADNERLASQKALCSELTGILKSKEDLSALHGKVQGLQDAWKEIDHPDRKLLHSFQNMVREYEEKVDQARQKQVSENRERRWAKSSLLHELAVTGRTKTGAISKKTEGKISKSWPAETSDDPLEQDMDTAYENLMAGNDPALAEDELEKMKEQARALCIQLEFIAGIPSPDEERDRRMKYQVDRLAESMSGEHQRQPATQEARAAEKVWLGMFVLPAQDFDHFGGRIRQALSAIYEG